MAPEFQAFFRHKKIVIEEGTGRDRSLVRCDNSKTVSSLLWSHYLPLLLSHVFITVCRHQPPMVAEINKARKTAVNATSEPQKGLIRSLATVRLSLNEDIGLGG